MRKYMVECTDRKTGLSMVLSECSYNIACDFLERELGKYRVDILDCRVSREGKTKGMTRIRTIHSITKSLMRTFYYDEERGYLLGE